VTPCMRKKFNLVSEDQNASIFRVEEWSTQTTSKKQGPSRAEIRWRHYVPPKRPSTPTGLHSHHISEDYSSWFMFLFLKIHWFLGFSTTLFQTFMLSNGGL
jgi:hypothetical protein